MHTKLKHIRKQLTENGLFQLVAKIAQDRGDEVYLVGGYVRDQFLDRQSKDIDFVVVGDGIGFANQIANELGKKCDLTIFKNFGTANIRYKQYEVEFVGARKESYSRDSRNPLVSAGTLREDLMRRDFTINALAISLNTSDFGELIDLFDGLGDLDRKVIQTPLDPDKTFSDDPLRMLRAIRFASQLNFIINEDTFNSIKLNRDRISIISQERITDELNKIIKSPLPSRGFYLLHDCGLLDIIFPELLELKGAETVENISHKDNFSHTLKVLDNIAGISDNLWLRWVAILHDIGKPITKKFDEKAGWTFHGHEAVGSKMVVQIFKRMKLPMNEKMRYVRKLVYLHLRPVALTKDEVTDSAIRRLIVDAGEDINDLLALCKADVTSKNPVKVKTFLNRFDNVKRKIEEVTEKDELRNWKNPITGEIIMKELKIRPSKEVGLIKEIIKEAILEGDIHNNYKEAYQYMLKVAKERGHV
ncbi:CCA tRNA nucleotidyltransferase [Bacteroidota bacterium]